MSGFPLAGLLRLRGVQERAAAERLSRAQIAARQAEARERHTRAALADSADAAVDVRTLAAIAAARAAARSELADLSALTDAQRGAVDEARQEHAEAKRRTRGLEKLEVAHRERERARELHAEQLALDEIGQSLAPTSRPAGGRPATSGWDAAATEGAA
jgi:flagellar FliJ protein